jgi:hypothetical protein
MTGFLPDAVQLQWKRFRQPPAITDHALYLWQAFHLCADQDLTLVKSLVCQHHLQHLI